MSHPTPFSRREFLQSGLVVVSTVATMPVFLRNSAAVLAADNLNSALASRPGNPDGRILVVVQLSGGNDGLNTVVPFGSRDYYNARPVIAIRENEAIAIDKTQGIGLHPSLRPIADMIGDNRAAVALGVGYPNPNRSHFASMDIWHTAETNGGRGLGWIGQAMDQSQAVLKKQGKELDSTCCVCIGSEAPLAAQGKRVKPVSFQNANLFRWTGSDLHPALKKEYDHLNRDIPDAAASSGNDPSAFVLRTALDAQLASDRIRKAVAQQSITSFPGGSLANQLRMVASMIRAELPTRVYYVSIGGFDTHAGQTGRQNTLLREFATATSAFYDELKAMGQQDRVMTMAFSEFGRRVQQNASNGTDHGTAGPVFLMGPMVKPGLIGTYPSLTELDKGDLKYNLDFRCLYAAILDNWMKIDSEAALGKRFQPADVLSV
ncbi:MAG: DUF1501 domain-containing protein [Phycisphaera sp.]|nr:DUF1501 domain-containing protein [Phycisphaera sp.]